MDACEKGYQTSRLIEPLVSLLFLMIRPIKCFTKDLLTGVCLFRAIWVVNQLKYIFYFEESLFISNTHGQCTEDTSHENSKIVMTT